MGLRTFSMHPAQILEVKSRVLKSDVSEIAPQVRKILRLEEPAKSASSWATQRRRGLTILPGCG